MSLNEFEDDYGVEYNDSDEVDDEEEEEGGNNNDDSSTVQPAVEALHL